MSKYFLQYCKSNINSFQSSFAFHIETSHLFCSATKMPGFYMKRNIALKWVNLSISTGDCTHIRGVFSALSSIYDRVFLQKKLTALNKKSPSQISYTVLNTPILSFLRWGYIYSSYFLKSASFGRISRNYAETVPFHKISASEN